MVDEFLPFSRPWIDKEEIDEVINCLESGWITTGPRVKQFEQALSEYLDSPHALTLSSATAGLHLALEALDLAPGDEVITTPLTFVATINTIVLAGGRPVFVDIDAGTRNMDIEQLAAAIGPRTRAIIPVHFAGLPVDLDPLYALAQKNDIRVIEDAAHAIGTEYKGRRIGAFGDTQVFSFHPNKNMTTGEGGCVTTRDDQLARRISLLRFHGIDREAWNRFGKSGSQQYSVIAPGYKYNMMDIQAALGIHQLERLDAFIDRRRDLAQRYQAELGEIAELALPTLPAYAHRHAWHLYCVLINVDEAGMTRDEFIEAMKTQNVGTGLHYQAVHLHPYYQENFGFSSGDFPIAEDVGERIVSLPLFPRMQDHDVDRTINAIKNVFRRT